MKALFLYQYVNIERVFIDNKSKNTKDQRCKSLYSILYIERGNMGAQLIKKNRKMRSMFQMFGQVNRTFECSRNNLGLARGIKGKN